jgi:hypothetical protein
MLASPDQLSEETIRYFSSRFLTGTELLAIVVSKIN